MFSRSARGDTKPMKIHADSHPGSGLKSKKVKFYMKIIVIVVNRSKNIPRKEGGNQVYLLIKYQ
jgi:hypothetical protein